jgi:hypothetical protein
MEALARSAVLAMGAVTTGSLAAYALSYVRTLRRIAEEPDITPGLVRFRWLPRFGTPFQTAIVQFSLRTLARSAQHRLVVAFYWGLGFALATLLVKAPRAQAVPEGLALGWQTGSVPIIVASLVTLVCAIVALRVAVALPRDLGANWIFRLAPGVDVQTCLEARRRAFLVGGVAPAALVSGVLVWSWPWGPALGHVTAVILLGLILVEPCLRGPQKIPFTCSYLPGKSRVHLAAYVGVVILLPLLFLAAEFERDALVRPMRAWAMTGGLVIVWMAARSCSWATPPRPSISSPTSSIRCPARC